MNALSLNESQLQVMKSRPGFVARWIKVAAARLAR